MIDDIYGAADALCIRLRAEGADNWANAITEAIRTGSTGTEILMALRGCLTELLGHGAISPSTRSLAEDLITDIGSAMKD